MSDEKKRKRDPKTLSIGQDTEREHGFSLEVVTTKKGKNMERKAALKKGEGSGKEGKKDEDRGEGSSKKVKNGEDRDEGSRNKEKKGEDGDEGSSKGSKRPKIAESDAEDSNADEGDGVADGDGSGEKSDKTAGKGKKAKQKQKKSTPRPYTTEDKLKFIEYIESKKDLAAIKRDLFPDRRPSSIHDFVFGQFRKWKATA